MQQPVGPEDWVEDLFFARPDPEVRDQWVSHDPFTGGNRTPSTRLATSYQPDYVNASFGDVKSINHAVGLARREPVHQASFFDGFIQDPATGNASVGPDADIWAFITPGETAGAPAVTGGGEIVAAFSNDEDTVAVQEFLSSPEWANARVSLGGVISANKGLDPANASSLILQQAITILQDENTTSRFDADLMPALWSRLCSGPEWSIDQRS